MTTTLSPPVPSSPVSTPAGATDHQAPDALLDRRRMVPGLHPADWARQPGLSDDGFCDSFASIALSRRLCAGLHCTSASRSVTVSQRGLGELDLSVHRAWDLAAENLLHLARGSRGLTFFTRPVSNLVQLAVPALQVATPGARPTAWLAHPHTFTVLHRHLCELLGAEAVYLAPTTEVLLAAPANAPELSRLSNHLAQGPLPAWLGTPLTTRVLTYRHGFPAVPRSAH